MPEIVTAPGFYSEASARGARGRWKNGNNTRFRKNEPEKLGGAQPMRGSDFDGVVRRIISFASLDSRPYLALTSNLRFYIYEDGNQINVTPIRATATLTNPFTSTAGSAIVTVDHAGHGLEVNDFVSFSGATASPIDSTLVDGEFQVLTVPTANTYTIQLAATVTTSEAAFGGTVTYSYEIATGQQDGSVGAGYGGGAFNEGTWGTPRSSSGILIKPRTVAIEPWGEDVIFLARGERAYIFDTSGGITSSNRATLIAESPLSAEYIVVSQEDRHLIYLGAHDGVDDDPMLIRWTSQEDYTVLTPSATNTAGDVRLEKGTRIITGIYAKGQSVILTDTAAYTMTYIGYPEVFSVRLEGVNCGGISPHCMAVVNGVTFWMSGHAFHRYDGLVQEIPCDVHDYVFRNINQTQKDKIVCGTNLEEGEIWWLYPTADSTEINRFVVFNYQENFWFYGDWDTWATRRTAWLDKSIAYTTPVAAGMDGKLHQHEVGRDDGTQALPAFIERFDDEINPGESDNMLISRLVLDFTTISGTVQVELSGKRYPGDSYRSKGPKTFTASTRYQNIRMRARQISMKVSCSGLGDHFRLSTITAEAQPMGKRG